LQLENQFRATGDETGELGKTPGVGSNKAFIVVTCGAARSFGSQSIEGLTVLALNPGGLIERRELYHRPLSSVLAFASELERILGGTLGTKLFEWRE
jgi:hypothetical protein